ncbi:hypothetical protein IFM89_014269 [Coptis chinensis]|uniref:Uncharacterized protein n=1 Tax=Coptis chinensis TaxID=261450 RepID=A0A835LEA6_9MAGN|nr:hypothetical protein IFM89_014269 [Coptis chinensis]
MTNNNLPRRIRKRVLLYFLGETDRKIIRDPIVRVRIFIRKREDLNHLGAHKINNVVAQALLAKRLGKKRIIAETWSWSTWSCKIASLCARFRLECIIYLGLKIWRGIGNVLECDFSKTEVRVVHSGTATLKGATSKAIRDWLPVVGGGSNVTGLFHEFVDDSDVRLIRWEAAPVMA